MQQNFNNFLRTNSFVLFRDTAFLLLCYFYISLWVRPELIYQRQEPIFFFDLSFVSTFLAYPGGLTDYIATFLSQFFIYPWLGGLVIIIILGLICLLAKLLIESIHRGNVSTTGYFIPAGLLLALHSQYRYLLSSTIGLLVTLGIFRLFIYFGRRHFSLRVFIYIIAGAMLYYFAGGHLFFFALLAIISEILNDGRPWLERILISIFYAGLAVLMPWLAASFLFNVSVRDAYLEILPFGYDFSFKIAAYLLYLFFPVFLITVTFWNRSVADESGKKSSKFRDNSSKLSMAGQGKTKLWIQTLALIVLTGLLALLSFDKYSKTLFQIDFYARHERWDDILSVFRKHPIPHEIVTYQVNRALYHTGKLGDEMFSYPQLYGVDGLILSTDASFSARLQTSDLFFELGHLNYALRWAHEAMSMRGETPWNLLRIAQINILKQDKAYAQICLRLLNKTLLFRGWAKHYQNYIDDNSRINHDEKLHHIQSLMPQSDFIIAPDNPTAELKNLLMSNNRNKMAFEYLMAYYLLARQLGDLADNLYRLCDFDYPSLPRHYQEALLLYMFKTKKRDINLHGYKINPVVIQRFNDFNLTLRKHKGDKEQARKELLNKHGNTYWYYVLYSKYIIPKSLKNKFDAITGATKNE